MRYQCLLFDLDGTLVDSRADLINSINLMLDELGLGTLPDSRVINFIGEGARLLVERSLRAAGKGLGESCKMPMTLPVNYKKDAGCQMPVQASSLQHPTSFFEEVDRALAIFRRHYREHLLDQTRVYPEVEETLAALRGIPKAIVSNKPYDFTISLLDGIGLLKHFKVIMGGDSLPERKPSPMMLLEAARKCQADVSDCLMVGDGRVDMAAGKAAGMKTCGYIPGFRGRTELAEAGADFLIERFGELRLLVESNLTTAR